MKTKHKFPFFILLYIVIVLLMLFFLKTTDMVLLDPKGLIALKERNLLVTATLLMLIVVIPVFFLTFIIAYRFRAHRENAKYTPDWDYSFLAESLWWGIPSVIVLVLSVMTWTSSHELDPFKPLENGKKPLQIQAVALQWKWLFIYPEEGIATVNYLKFPVNTPLNFEVTADAPMNSIWIPQLGGQIYAMPGMRTKLHLIANEVGNFSGSSANLSGKGFSGMKFTATATSQEEFSEWVQSLQKLDTALNLEVYNRLAEPSEYNPAASYVLKDPGLFDGIVMKYMMPPSKNP